MEKLNFFINTDVIVQFISTLLPTICLYFILKGRIDSDYSFACFDIDGKRVVSVIFCGYDDDYFRDSINLKNYPLDKLKLISWMPMPVAPKSFDRYIWTVEQSKYMQC